MTRAILLAGSLNDGLLKECSSATIEALIKIGNKYMVEYVVEALKQAKRVERIIVSGPEEELRETLETDEKVSIVQSGSTIIESLLNALETLDINDPSRILVVTSDIPLITGSILDNFLEKCLEEEGDVIYPIVSKSINEVKFPEVERTYAKLREGIYTGGNIFLINPQIIKPCSIMAEELIKLRKKPLKLVNYIGFSYFLKYILRRLSIGDIEERVFNLFSIKGKALPISFPEIGVDVDKPSDLKLVENILDDYGKGSNLG